jgi:hypothetical protein
MRALEEKLGDELELWQKGDHLSSAKLNVVYDLLKSDREHFDQQITQIIKRLDNIDSAIVAKSEEGSLTGDREEPANEEVNWDALISSLKSLSKQR